jgi:putative hydrolase of the HAD superfamily
MGVGDVPPAIMRRLSAVFFDLDETLVDYERAEIAGLLAAEGRLDELARPATRTPGLIQTVLCCYQTHFVGRPEGFRRLRTISLSDFRSELTHLALQELKLPANLAPQLVHAYETAADRELRLLPGAIETLSALTKRVPLGLITNGPAAVQNQKLERFGLHRFFQTIVIDTEYGKSKPDPDIFRHAAGTLGLSSGEICLHIGDNFQADVLGAASVGWDTVWIDHGRSLPGAIPSFPFWRVTHSCDLLQTPPLREIYRDDDAGFG